MFMAGCAAQKSVNPGGAYSAVEREAGSLAKTISAARGDGKEVLAAHLESMSLLERIDYKATVLLR